jgi:hypothetical protein
MNCKSRSFETKLSFDLLKELDQYAQIHKSVLDVTVFEERKSISEVQTRSWENIPW